MSLTCGKASLVKPSNGNGKLVCRQSALINGSVDLSNWGRIKPSYINKREKPILFIDLFAHFRMEIFTCEVMLNIVCIGSDALDL